MHKSERYRILLSISNSKKDMKRRWKDILPEDRKALRQEWGDWVNNSYPIDKDIYFLDYLKNWY